MNRTSLSILALAALGLGVQGCSSQRVASNGYQDDMYYSGSAAAPAPVRTTVTETTRTTTTDYVDQGQPQQSTQTTATTTPDYYQPGASNGVASNQPSTTTTDAQGNVTNNYYGPVYNQPGYGGSSYAYTSPVGFYRPWYRPGLTMGFAYSSWSGFTPMIGFSYGCPYYYDPFWYTPPPPIVYSPFYNPYFGWGSPYMGYYSPWYGGGFYDPYRFGYAYGYYPGYYYNSYYYNNYNGYYNNYNGGYYQDNGQVYQRPVVVRNTVATRPGGAVVTPTGGRVMGVTPGGYYRNNPNQTVQNPGGRPVVDQGQQGTSLPGGHTGVENLKAISGRDAAANPNGATRTYTTGVPVQGTPAGRNTEPAQQPRTIDAGRTAAPAPAQQPTNQPAQRGYYNQPATNQPVQRNTYYNPQPQQPSQPAQREYNQPAQRENVQPQQPSQPAQQPQRPRSYYSQEAAPAQPQQPTNGYYGRSQRSYYSQPATSQPTTPAPAPSRWGGNNNNNSGNRGIDYGSRQNNNSGGGWRSSGGGGSSSGGSQSSGGFGSGGGQSGRPR